MNFRWWQSCVTGRRVVTKSRQRSHSCGPDPPARRMLGRRRRGMRWKRRRKVVGTGEEQEERLMTGGQIFLDLHLPVIRGETFDYRLH